MLEWKAHFVLALPLPMTIGRQSRHRAPFAIGWKRTLSRIESFLSTNKKSPTRYLGASSNAPSREERGLLRHGRVAWLTAFQPITVAGPRPIRTAFPASPACKLDFECMPCPPECQCTTETAQQKMVRRKKRRRCSAVLPVGLALFHQCS